MDHQGALRRRELAVDDEEGLLLLQEEFLKSQSNSQPAARVTRVTRKAAEPSAAAEAAASQDNSNPAPALQQHASASAKTQHNDRSVVSIIRDAARNKGQQDKAPSPAAAATASEQAPMTPAISGILFEVKERQPSAAPEPPPAASPTAAFPAAVHRKQSKFALGRRKQADTAAAPGAVHTAAAVGTSPAAHTAMPGSSSSSISGGVQAAPDTAAAVRPESAGIHEQNMARISEMSAEEVEEAQSELAGRFSAQALAFLKARANKKKQQQPQPGGDAQQQQQAVDRQEQAEAVTRPAAASAAAAAAGIRKGFLAKPERSTAAAAAGAAGLNKGFLAGTAATRKSAAKPTFQNAAANTVASPAATAPTELLPAVARLRFSTDGQVLEMTDLKTPSVPDAEVLLRDNISRAAGVVPQGYTLPEIRVLLRSSHAPQRAAGFRMLATVLRRAQPSVSNIGRDGQLVPQPVLLAQQQQQQRDTGVRWHQVWEYAIVALRVVILCRLGLDDDNAQVLSAAADAAAVLLGSSSSEQLIEEVGVVTSGLSWPLTRRVSLRRFSNGGAWDRVEGLVKAAAEAQQQQQPQAAAAAEDAPEDLAAVDPLAGFMATEPLTRIRFLLQNRSGTEAVVPLLLLLEAVATSSSTAAETVVRCKGLPEALIALLGLPVSNSVTSGKGGSTDLAAAAGAQQQQQQQQRKSGSRVAALRLLRLLCASSSLACQLLRTAGLDTVVQMFICSSSSGSSAPGSSSSSDSDVESQLLLLEALRIWMVAATHGVCLTHMDVMFQFIAALLQPPPAAATASPASSSSSSDESAAVQRQLTAAAYQLVEVLVRHALAVNNGAKTLGSQMISPGCAAAIAQEAATHWLNLRVLAQVGQGLVSQVDCQLPYTLNPNHPSCSTGSKTLAGFSSAEGASSQAAWWRVLAGLHPALLVPPASAVLSGFAAVLGFLNTYWTSLQIVPKQLAAELLSQLESVGLAGSSSSGSSSGSTPDLAHVLLTALSGTAAATAQVQQQQLGQALLQHCLGLLAAARGCAGSSSSIGADLLACHAFGAAAASTLLAVCELQQQLQHKAEQLPPQQQQLGLPAAVAEVVSSNMLHWVSTASQTLAIEPWTLAQQNMRQYQIRLLIRLSKPLLQGLYQQQVMSNDADHQLQESDVSDQQQQEESNVSDQQQQLLWKVIDGLLCVLPLSGPGQEAQALQALQLLFGNEAVQWPGTAAAAAVVQPVQPAAVQLLRSAGEAVQQLLQQGGPLAAAAAGIRSDTLPKVTTESNTSLYPYYPAVAGHAAAAGVNVADWARTLLDGYAVTWLSVIAQHDDHQQQQQQGSAAVTVPVLPLHKVYVTEVEGSRLPVPPEWLMAEILALPSSSSSNNNSAPVHPGAAALLLALGLERTPSSCYMPTVKSSHKLEALLQLLYVYNVGELLTGQQQQQLAAAWQQPDARWAAAVLSEQYSKDIVLQQQQQQYAQGMPGVDDGSKTRSAADRLKAGCPVHKALTSHQQQQLHITEPQPAASDTKPSTISIAKPQLLFPTWAASSAGTQTVDRLVRDLAELSMGDPMFACHVALLLLPAAGLTIQRAVWGSMIDHGALHLLPPPSMCLLGPEAYLRLSSSSSSNSRSTTVGGLGFFDVQLVGDMAKTIAQGDLKKALQMGGLAGQLALHGIAAVCLDQKTWTEDRHTAASSSSRGKAVAAADMAVNVLRGVVRACPLTVLQQLVQVGVVRGIAVADQARALVQSAHGDAVLMDKVQQLLARVQ